MIIFQAKKNLSQLPNFAFSVPLAKFLRFSEKSDDKDISRTVLMEDADKGIQEALIMFPMVLYTMYLMDHTTCCYIYLVSSGHTWQVQCNLKLCCNEPHYFCKEWKVVNYIYVYVKLETLIYLYCSSDALILSNCWLKFTLKGLIHYGKHLRSASLHAKGEMG